MGTGPSEMAVGMGAPPSFWLPSYPILGTGTSTGLPREGRGTPHWKIECPTPSIETQGRGVAWLAADDRDEWPECPAFVRAKDAQGPPLQVS